MKKRPNPTPGEWQTDKDGRRYRMVGPIKEYMATIQTTYGVFDVDRAPSQIQNMKEQEQRQRQERSRKQQEDMTGRICPIKKAKQAVKSSCEKSCAWYTGKSCMLADLDIPVERDTEGRDCILTGKCISLCAMYNGGCTLPEVMKGIKAGRK